MIERFASSSLETPIDARLTVITHSSKPPTPVTSDKVFVGEYGAGCMPAVKRRKIAANDFSPPAPLRLPDDAARNPLLAFADLACTVAEHEAKPGVDMPAVQAPLPATDTNLRSLITILIAGGTLGASPALRLLQTKKVLGLLPTLRLPATDHHVRFFFGEAVKLLAEPDITENEKLLLAGALTQLLKRPQADHGFSTSAVSDLLRFTLRSRDISAPRTERIATGLAILTHAESAFPADLYESAVAAGVRHVNQPGKIRDLLLQIIRADPQRVASEQFAVLAESERRVLAGADSQSPEATRILSGLAKIAAARGFALHEEIAAKLGENVAAYLRRPAIPLNDKMSYGRNYLRLVKQANFPHDAPIVSAALQAFVDAVGPSLGATERALAKQAVAFCPPPREPETSYAPASGRSSSRSALPIPGPAPVRAVTAPSVLRHDVLFRIPPTSSIPKT